MFAKIYCPVLETRFGRWGGHRPLRIRKRKRNGYRRESEGFIVLFEIAGQQREACPWGITLTVKGVRVQWHYLKQKTCFINEIEVG